MPTRPIEYFSPFLKWSGAKRFLLKGILLVPTPIRQKVAQRFEDEDVARGAKEFYFDLIDYRTIVMDNWSTFEPILAYEKNGNAKKRTTWLAVLNQKGK